MPIANPHAGTAQLRSNAAEKARSSDGNEAPLARQEIDTSPVLRVDKLAYRQP